MERTLDWGILGIGFDLLFGWTGLLSFGQAAFYGTGGFVAVYLLLNNMVASVWLALAIGTVAAGLFGLLVGWLAVRRIGIYFAMITLAFGQMAYFLEFSPLRDYTGGENGLPGVPEPTLGFGAYAFRIHTGAPMYWLLAAFFFACFVLGRRIVHSPFGAILRAIKENTARAAMLGHAVPRYKLAVFVIAAMFAGLAGGLLGVFQSFMPPDAFALDTSGQLVVQTVIGGVGTLIGPTVGAAVWLWLRDNLQAHPRRRRVVEADPRRDLRRAGHLPAPRHRRRDPPSLACAAPAPPTEEPTGAPAAVVPVNATMPLTAPLVRTPPGRPGAGSARPGQALRRPARGGPRLLRGARRTRSTR